ncbi:hypothetical protein PRIC1_009842 [Phytophthora ramorum]
MDVLDRYARAEAAKHTLEAEMEALAAELTSGNSPGLRGPLVDSEGFPRADIDVHRVRQLRHDLAVKRTDLGDLMKEIETLLPLVFEVKSGQKQEETARNVGNAETAMQQLESEWKRKLKQVTHEEAQLRPFAVVQNVHKESPSAAARLQPQDQVLRFGSADATNHRELAAVRDIVTSNIGSGIRVLVRRGEEVLAVELTPMRWSGDGVLGCLLQPM